MMGIADPSECPHDDEDVYFGETATHDFVQCAACGTTFDTVERLDPIVWTRTSADDIADAILASAYSWEAGA